MREHLVRNVAWLGLAVILGAGCSSTEPPAPTSVAITPSGTLAFTSLNETKQLSAQVLDQHGDPMTGQVITWSSTSSSIATVDGTGTVTSKTNGSTTVKATSGTLSATVPVTVAQAASTIAKTTGDGQQGVAGGPLGVPVEVQLTDGVGTPVFGATVTFAVTAGGGQVANASVVSDAAGKANTTWTLGPSGTQTLSATSATLSASFSATLVTSAVTAFAGTGQTGLVGYGTNVRPAVRVASAGNVPVAGVQVVFAVTGGGGSVTTATVNTNAQGIAQVGKWTLGAAPGANTMTATVTGGGVGGSPVTFTATGSAPLYNITLRNIGPALSAPVQAAFDSAQAMWQRVIYSEQLDQAVNGSVCGGLASLNETIDDIIILLKFDAIDGPGNILGQAGACAVRGGNGLPWVGQMVFDSADVATMIGNGSLNSVILHEMGHVLGFSPGIWAIAAASCYNSPSSPGTVVDTYFSCTNARTAFDSLGGTTYTGGNKVPLENCGAASPAGCGSGTVNAHWREPVFVNELMTGYINAGSNPLSILTIGLYGDLGYSVNMAAAQTYTHVFTTAGTSPGVRIELKDDVLHIPIEVTDPQGRVLRVINP